MSQDNMAKMECQECKRTNYFPNRNNKTLKNRLELSKHCKFCGKHTPHKQTK